MRAFRGLKGFKGQAKFSSWLYRIAQNLCRDWLRLERRVGLMPPCTLKLRIRGRDLAAIRTGQLSAEEARKLVETP